MSGSITISTPQQPQEPTVIQNAAELMNFAEQLAIEMKEIRAKLFNDPRSGEGMQMQSNAEAVRPQYGLQQIISMSCSAIAGLVGEARTINGRL